MEQKDFDQLIKELVHLGRENEWMEFKHNYSDPHEIGEYLSALSNSACLFHQKYGYLIYGIEDATHQIIGTKFKAKTHKVGNQPLENWLATQLEPRLNFEILEMIYQEKKITLFKIESAKFRPVRFKGTAYIRINSCKKRLSDHPEKERKIWEITSKLSFEEDIALEKIEEDLLFELLDYPAYFSLMGLKLPDSRAGIISKFLEEKLIVKNYSRYDITNLGAILFGQNLEKIPPVEKKSGKNHYL